MQTFKILTGQGNNHNKKLSINSVIFIFNCIKGKLYPHVQTFIYLEKLSFLNLFVFSPYIFSSSINGKY